MIPRPAPAVLDYAAGRRLRGLPPARPDGTLRAGDWVRIDRTDRDAGRLGYLLERRPDGHLLVSIDGDHHLVARDRAERVAELGPHGLKAGDRVTLLGPVDAGTGRAGTIEALHGRSFRVRFDTGALRTLPYWRFDPSPPATRSATIPRAARPAVLVGADGGDGGADDTFDFDPEPPRAA